MNGNVYELGQVQYILLRLDSALSSGEASYNYRIISVEHVLPQNPAPNSQWLRWFPNEEERKHDTHRLGNLVLLSRQKNSQAQNYEFDRKKSGYFLTKDGVSAFALTTQVLQESVWTPEIIERRQTELIGKLCEVWAL